MAVARAQAEIERDAAATLFEHRVEAGRITVAIEGVQMSSQDDAGPSSSAALHAELMFGFGADVNVSEVTSQSKMMSPAPVSASARRSESETMPCAMPAREGVLHDRETDQHDDQHEAADQRRRHEIVGERARHGEARRRHPDEQQQPGRDQHHGAVVAVRRQDRGRG